ncbi:MAG: TatD family hydrolase [Herminiimonas sp.]|nr:TatD family hydrolase [Herminiimonas sp.]
MWIDTHCHLDAAEFGDDRPDVAARALRKGVSWIVIPAVDIHNFDTVRTLANSQPNCTYALGIHPMYVPQSDVADLAALRTLIPEALQDPRFVAIGEIGLDFFLPALCVEPMRQKQEHFYSEQLKIARDFDLPVLLHVRHSQDLILKYLRRITVRGGIAHAFNGSLQQAQIFIDLGFKLGLGGAMTYTRALQIRRLAATLPLEALVLETDAPDLAPSWLHPGRNSPEQIPAIGAILAELRAMTPADVARATSDNAAAALPRLPALR